MRAGRSVKATTVKLVVTVHPDGATNLRVAGHDETGHHPGRVRPKPGVAVPVTADRPSMAAVVEANHAAISIAKLPPRRLCPNSTALTFRTIAALSHWPNKSK